MIRFILLVSIFFTSILFCFADRLSPDEAESLVAEATFVRHAYEASDIDTVIRTAHPQLIKMMGGRTQAAEILRKSVEQLRASGVRTLESKLTEPGDIYRSGDEIVCFMPRKSLIIVAKKTFTSLGFVIAARKASGSEWSFLDGAGLGAHPEMLKVIFPGLPDDVKLPPTSATAVDEKKAN